MAVMESKEPGQSLQKHTNSFRLRAQACELRSFDLVPVSGTAVASVES